MVSVDIKQRHIKKTNNRFKVELITCDYGLFVFDKQGFGTCIASSSCYMIGKECITKTFLTDFYGNIIIKNNSNKNYPYYGVNKINKNIVVFTKRNCCCVIQSNKKGVDAGCLLENEKESLYQYPKNMDINI